MSRSTGHFLPDGRSAYNIMLFDALCTPADSNELDTSLPSCPPSCIQNVLTSCVPPILSFAGDKLLTPGDFDNLFSLSPVTRCQPGSAAGATLRKQPFEYSGKQSLASIRDSGNQEEHTPVLLPFETPRESVTIKHLTMGLVMNRRTLQGNMIPGL